MIDFLTTLGLCIWGVSVILLLIAGGIGMLTDYDLDEDD